MDNHGNSPINFFQEFFAWIKALGKDIRKAWRNLKKQTLSSFAGWVDPKLQPYRKKPLDKPANIKPDAQPSPKPEKVTNVQTDSGAKICAPQTIEEFLDMMKHTPRSVLNQRERHVIATIMKFPEVKVSDLMLPQSAITYVKATEVLGPLTLDRLYRSGFQHFPVIDHDHKIIGLVHTTALNSLEIKQTSRAHEILDPKVYYLREDYTLNQALAAFLRTNCYFFLVIDKYERIVGMLTYQMIVDYLLGETPADDFTRDDDRLAVAKRK